MNRKSFLASFGLAGGMILTGDLTAKKEKNPMPLDSDLVREFVVAGHNDLNKVKKMVKEIPRIINCSWDWGGGDYETAMEGAGHTGNEEVVSYLIERGARPNIFTLAMMGEYELVKNWIGKYPELLTSWGPHGYSLLHHAQLAVKNADQLINFLRSEGLDITKFS